MPRMLTTSNKRESDVKIEKSGAGGVHKQETVRCSPLLLRSPGHAFRRLSEAESMSDFGGQELGMCLEGHIHECVCPQ